MKSKLIWKIILWICVSPFIIFLLWGLYSAIAGLPFIYSDVYGFEAFELCFIVLIALFYEFWYIVLALIILIIISIYNIVKK